MICFFCMILRVLFSASPSGAVARGVTFGSSGGGVGGGVVRRDAVEYQVSR